MFNLFRGRIEMKRELIVVLLMFILVLPIVWDSVDQESGGIDKRVVEPSPIIDDTNAKQDTMSSGSFNELPEDIKDLEIEPTKRNEIMNNLNQFNGYFTANRGQVGNDSIRYYIQGGGIWFLDDEVMFELREYADTRGRRSQLGGQGGVSGLDFDAMEKSREPEPIEYRSVVIELEFVGANDVEPVGKERLSWNNNYFYGNDSSKWCTDVPNFGEVWYENIYDNIDLRYYTIAKGLKYDFIVHPGGEPEDIKISVQGANGLELDNNDDLKIKTKLGELIDTNLEIYQNIDSSILRIDCSFKIMDLFTYGYEIISEYDKDRILIIDPIFTLEYSTFVGTGIPQDIAIDTNKNAYVTGYGHPPFISGSYNSSSKGHLDVFVFKLNRNGSSLIYSSHIGGSLVDKGYGISVDSQGHAYLTGLTYSSNFPTTVGANDVTINSVVDVFVLKMNQNGSALLYSTFIGGKEREWGYGIYADSKGAAYVSGETRSKDFPITSNAYDKSHEKYKDIFVLKLNSNGSKIIYSTYIGGNEYEYFHGFAVDPMGNAYVTGTTGSTNFPTTMGAYNTSNEGSEIFVFKLNQNGSNLIYSTTITSWGTYLGQSLAIAVDSKGCAYVTGSTNLSYFPVTVGAYDTTYKDTLDDVFVLKLNQNGSKLIYSTYIGGKRGQKERSGNDKGLKIAVDPNGNAYVTGITYSPDFPTTTNAYDDTHNGVYDVFVVKLNTTGSSLLYSTFIGGAYYDRPYGISIDSNKCIYVVGNTNSTNFPFTSDRYYNESYENHIFVLKINLTINNTPPDIHSFTATPSPEGSKVIFTVNASDQDNDTLVYSYDLNNDGGCDFATYNNTISRIWPDDYTGNVTVHVSDGTSIVNATTKVIVYNVAPTVKLSTRQNGTGSGNGSAIMSVRIAGEKWHDVRVELNKNSSMVTNGTLVRYPGSPNNQMLHFTNNTINSSANWTAILYYTPDDDPVNGQPNGATPCWVLLNLSNGSQIKLHHTFKVRHEKTHKWVVDLNPYLTINSSNSGGSNLTFTAVAFDPGADDLTFYWDFGDGTNLTHSYPNNNTTFPVNIADVVKHSYSMAGSYIVRLIVRDDDRGEAIIKVTIIVT
jgi:hypothetical protein